MKMQTVRMVLGLVLVCAAGAAYGVSAADCYDLKAIQNDPLDAKVLKSEEKDGLVTEEVEFTADKDAAGQPIRIFGILAYPKGAAKLPGIMWGQSGMYAAGTWAPHIFAKKGYVGFNITAPHDKWNAYGAFNVAKPADANLVRYTIEHMRAITYMCSRPEVDPERIGMGGASYGGVYATLIAGLDPRVKAGMSFFAGGNHHLGSNLPQFTGLPDAAALELFKQVADGATGLRQRAVPFLWGVAANDHWFHLPAVVKTFEDSIGEKRMGIMPLWAHGFPESMDNQLLDWFDVYLGKTRKPYDTVSALTVTNAAGKLMARWTWDGENPVAKAELVVSWGRALPWHGWVNRFYLSVPATVDGKAASAEIPVPEPGLDVFVFGNIVDDKSVTISTVPVAATPAKLGIAKATSRPVLNAFPFGEFEAGDVDFFTRLGEPCGKGDPAFKHSGAQSMRIDAPAQPFGMKLFNVFERGHKLSLWLRAEGLTALTVQVKGVYPANWKTPGTQAALKAIPGALPVPDEKDIPVYEVKATVGSDWKEFTVDCPYKNVAVEGYQLVITGEPGATGKYWMDGVRFEPQWQ